MKKNFVLSIASLILSLFIQAQEKIIQLYDGPAPGSESWNWSEGENENNMFKEKVVFNVTRPTLTAFLPDPAVANGTAVIICPGGAFHTLSINNEGMDAASWLVKKGVACFVLKYRLARTYTADPLGEWFAKIGKKEFEEATMPVIPLAIADGKAAIAYVRKHATEYGILQNRIGIMGFSAGGTVAGATAFNYSNETKPNFIAPVYAYFPPEMQGKVSNDAPPLFIAAASDDQLGLAPHSVELYNQWIAAKKTAELHMYAKGGHGFGMKKQNLPVDNWIESFSNWLNLQGLLKRPVSNPAYAPYEKKEFAFADGKRLPYRILYPDNYDKNKKYPLVLFLHGAGERGNDNEKQLTHGAKLFLKEENRKNFPAIIVFPQCPEESFWAVTRIDMSQQPFKISFDYNAEPNWPLAAANELVKKLIGEEAVDKSKVYITGLSMGGMGTFESVHRYPDLYAAALPVCGGGDVPRYDKRIKKTAFWVFHGAADAVVNVDLSRQMVDKLKTLKAEVKYSEYPGVNHNSWDNAFAEKEYVSWMFSHKLKK
ncbi:MAG: prolyl oligopeptidase family serine peptidase [Chitinophagaceae bacterium]|nr:prolyl oligopeptidase family serine peptidase [Chitinophagaceae bacterium]